MRIGLLGLAGAGKKTLFKLLTGATELPQTQKELSGIFRIRDPRIDKLSKMYNPKKTTYANLEMVLLPDIEKSQGKAPWLNDVRNLDGICSVVRAFKDESVYHPEGSVNPARDLETFSSELLFADLVFLESRKNKLTSEINKRMDTEKKKELEIVEKFLKGLEGGSTVSKMEITPGERKIISAYQMLTNKGVVVALNYSADDDKAELEKSIASAGQGNFPLGFMDIKLEEEISKMQDPAEREEFLKELGIEESGVDKLSRLIYSELGLISYFTVGEDEVRAWTVKKNSTAPQAARAIHTSLEKGFIRAEHMTYDDLIQYGSEAEVQKAGKSSLKGKDYIVQDGDILSIRATS
jgi:ribosome-binding ATPase